MRLLLLAKAPVAGRSKTRLQSELSPDGAAAVAEAALRDTLDVVLSVPDVEVELVLDGRPGSWLPAGTVVRPQVSGNLGTRISAALRALPGPALLIGMDTPQVRPALLQAACAQLADVDAVLGLATDGGWWALGLADAVAHGHLVEGIPTSLDTTGRLQRQRLLSAGLSLRDLPVLTDVDTPDDARLVAGMVPGGRFGRLVSGLLQVAA
jgi:glycosyltransferase A (GT-A) superfamily protein (DUF2064 family)